ncbi:probable 2-hydroxy-6-oxo-6-phenylhexa-2,4-dienoate hydrolase (plasmid) [Rhodococcus jostii RHA1]|uniref:Probable 2-hydroxy-6-oxo-6-phenylhexa-2,4-dienoate hydrolase n=1 Tax=Rhodococcus jostii (strain RHA1) TaxID=101510 RepID=Q0RVD1_RHOJR|nr:alpha/beta hydrolase [Rhodococcus jostii]ABH00755.1 probable 2-hydroxy-6-oxo-6-phenylhexa-2,4-dienoate hydrolase [Rhodococcus jostii RHA1]
MNPSRIRRLRPVPDTEPQMLFRTIHGYRRAFRMAGDGPALLLLHGIGDNSSTWTEIIPHLAENYTVIAPDLLGHGRSDKPRADYSVAAYANGMRDLLSTLGIDHATVIGHSLGGGIAMQFAYQFPQMVDRLILVSAGGITKDVHPLLRLAATPILNEALKLLRLPGAVPAVRWVGTVLTRLHGTALRPGAALHDTPDLVRILTELPEPTACEAYLRTLRAVVDWRGQTVTMLDRCYLTARFDEAKWRQTTQHRNRRDSSHPTRLDACRRARRGRSRRTQRHLIRAQVTDAGHNTHPVPGVGTHAARSPVADRRHSGTDSCFSTAADGTDLRRGTGIRIPSKPIGGEIPSLLRSDFAVREELRAGLHRTCSATASPKS